MSDQPEPSALQRMRYVAAAGNAENGSYMWAYYDDCASATMYLDQLREKYTAALDALAAAERRCTHLSEQLQTLLDEPRP